MKNLIEIRTHTRTAACWTAALLCIATFRAEAASATWSNPAGGAWGTAANWTGSVIATNVDGIADFSTLDITAARTVTIGGVKYIGSLIFADTTQDFNWSLTTGTNVLAVSSGLPQIIVSNGQNTTISASLQGMQGFAKLGGGTLTLSGSNFLTNGVQILEGAVTASAAGSFGNHFYATNCPVTLSNAVLTISAALANAAWTNNVILLGTSNFMTCGAATPGFRGTAGNSSVISGSGILTINCGANTPGLSGHMDGFSGTIIMNASGAGGVLFGHNQDSGFFPGADGITGSSATAFEFNAGKSYLYNGAMPGTNYMGELRGGTNTTLYAKNGRSGDVTLEVGALGTTTSFAGSLRDNFAIATLTRLGLRKVGSGTLTLSGASTNTGPTEVRGGTLDITGSLGNTPITVYSGGTFQLDGSIGSTAVTVNSGGNLVLGAGAVLLSSAAISLNGIMDTTAFGGGGGYNLGSASLAGSGVVSGSITLGGTTVNPGAIGAAGTLTVTNGNFTATAGTIQFDLSNTPGSGNDLLDVNGVLDFSSPGVTISINKLVGSLGPGTYVLAKASVGLTGTAGNLTLVGAGPLDFLQFSGNQLQLVVSAVASLTWTGNGAGNLWDIGASTCWLNGASPSTFANGNAVFFNNTGSSNPVVNISATVAPNVVNLSGSANYTFTGSGDISDGASLVKSGTGTLTILNTNSFTGIVFLNSGTIAIGNAGTNGSVAGNITNGATLNVVTPLDQLVTNTIIGTGSFTKSGAGVLTLTANNGMSGPTTVSAGTLSVGDGVNPSGALGTGAVTNNATLLINQTAALTMSNAIRNTSTVIKQGAGTVVLAGAISGNGSLINNDGPLELSGNNTFSGPTVITAGTVMLRSFSGFGTGNVLIDDSGGGSIHLAPPTGSTNILANNIKLPAAASQQFEMDGTSLSTLTTVRLTGLISGGTSGNTTTFVDSGVSGNTRAVIVLENPANSFTTIPEVFRGTLAVLSDAALGDLGNGVRVNSRANWSTPFDVNQQGLRFDANNITLNANRTIELVSNENIDVQGFDATIAGSFIGQGLIKLGSGKLTLNGAGSLNGTTTVSAGTLLINNEWTGTTLSVSSGATLGGTGTIHGAVAVASGGTLSPGSSIGKLTISNSVTLNTGSTTLIEINAGSGSCDKVVGADTITFGGALTAVNTGGTFVNGQTFQLFSGTNYAGNFAVTNLPALTGGLQWNWDATTGTLSVGQSVSTTPVSITSTVNGSNLQLSWPADHIGWRLEVQTNSAGFGNNWSNWPGANATNLISVPIDRANRPVFFRLVTP